MKCLGIESTAHTLGVGITDREKILVNEKDAYKPEIGKGIVPSEAAEHHSRVKYKVMNEALDKSGLKEDQLDIIAVASGPGLPPCLLEGVKMAKELSRRLEIPLVPINHCLAHIEIGKKDCESKDPLIQYVSGGNTQILSQSGNRYRIYGETLDIGIGNAFDKFARGIGLKMPGGPKVMKLAEKGTKYIELPYTVKGMDLAFSGLVTEAIKNSKKSEKEDISYSFQETALSMLLEVTERALAHTKKKELLLTGGVAANSRLQEMDKSMAKEHDSNFKVPRKEYCGDNGAMIAYTGWKYSSKKKSPEEVDIQPRWRPNTVEVPENNLQ